MRALAALLPIALLLAGCSGGVDPAERAAYIAKAEAVCTKAVAEQKKLRPPTGAADFAPAVSKAVVIAERVLTDLSALTPPEGDRKDLDAKVFGPLEEQLQVAKKYEADVQRAVRDKQASTLLSLAGNPPTETKADLRFMKRYGFDVCVKAADTSD